VEKHRLYISSSKAGASRIKESPWRFPWVAVGVFILLAILEIFVFRTRWFWAAVPRSDVGIYYVMEDELRVSALKPKIVIFGDSRVREAVNPAQLERKLGLKRGEVVNCALTGGTPWDARLLLERNPHLLDSVQLIIYQPSDWQFNHNSLPNNRVRRFASLKKRASYKNFTLRTELVVGFFIQTIAAREVTVGNIKHLMKILLGKNTACKNDIVDKTNGRIRWRLEEKEIGPDSVNVRKNADWFFKNYEYSQNAEDDLAFIAKKARQRRIHMLLLFLPVRDAYDAYVEENYWEENKEYHQRLLKFAEKSGVEIWGDSTTKIQAGIKENCYYDYGHLTLKGMRAYSNWLAERVALKLGLMSSDTTAAP